MHSPPSKLSDHSTLKSAGRSPCLPSQSPHELPIAYYRQSTPPENDLAIDYKLHGCTLKLHRVTDACALQPRRHDDIIMILDGGLYSPDEDPILVAGDVVKPVTWQRLVNNFNAPKGITVLTINKS